MITICFLFAGLAAIIMYIGGRREELLMKDMAKLREDNKALMEALMMDRGKPNIFHGELVRLDSEGWLDFKKDDN
jgi:hypothetical protein